MKEYEIWVEGFVATGQVGTAHLIGKECGKDFIESVLWFMAKKHNHGIDVCQLENINTGEKSIGFSIWGGRLFDNESDARASFG